MLETKPYGMPDMPMMVRAVSYSSIMRYYVRVVRQTLSNITITINGTTCSNFKHVPCLL